MRSGNSANRGARRVQQAWSRPDAPFPVSAEDFAALLIGRRRDAWGTPLIRSPLGSPPVIVSPAGINDFAYDGRIEGRPPIPWVWRCPVSAHIRKTNPRTADAAARHRSSGHPLRSGRRRPSAPHP